MLKFLPTIYPDESAYSYFCRLYVRSGYSNRTAFMREVFRSEGTLTEYDFIFPLRDEFRVELDKHTPFEDLLLRHSLFPYYGRFLSKERRIAAYKYAISNKPNLYKMLPIVHGAADDYLRYCPKCVEQDRAQFGECYYHRAHLIPHVYICTYHNCALVDTDILNNNSKRGNLQPLEIVLGNKILEHTVQYSDDDINVRVAKYLNEIMCQPFDLNIDTSVGAYLNNRLDNKYFSPRGERILYDVLHRDICDYYSNLNDCDMKRWRITYMFKHRMYNFNPYDIALVALFERIPPKELCKMSNMKESRIVAFDEKVRELRQQNKTVEDICNILHISKGAVTKILSGSYDGTENRYVRIIARKRYDWAECDDKYCQRFGEFLASNPPEVTLRAAGIYFGEDKTLRNFPKLRHMIAQYQKDTHFFRGKTKKRKNITKLFPN